MAQHRYTQKKRVVLPKWLRKPSKLTIYGKWVLAMLIDDEENKGCLRFVDLLYSDYAAQANCSVKTIKRTLQDLERRGIIKIEKGRSDGYFTRIHIEYDNWYTNVEAGLPENLRAPKPEDEEEPNEKPKLLAP